MDLCDIGVTGLATMGANLARNAARKGFAVAVHNRTNKKTEELVAEFGHEGRFVPATDAKSFVASLAKPRAILMMVKAGKPVDDVIAEFVPLLEPGDILIDGGNSLFSDTRRRGKELEAKGLRYLGVGVSGGEEGALEGPSMMPGGDPEAYARVQPIFEKIAAQVDGTPCCTYIGPDGAGHYVKMVHNGIEYADMQLIAESYELLRSVYEIAPPQMADIFDSWKDGDLDSYLIEITAAVLRKMDEATGRPLVDVILDEAEQKGTGRWTVIDALEIGVPVPAIAEAVFARVLSSLRDQREAASKIFTTDPSPTESADEGSIDLIRDALYASKIVAYAQGFAQMAGAAKQYGWELDLAKIATIWRGGCIIRAEFLDRIKEAYEGASADTNLLTIPYFKDALVKSDAAWRRTIVLAVAHGVAIPAFSAALAFFDGYRRATGPANLIQGLRDYFGAHTYHRTDREGTFHTRWAQDGNEVRVDS